METGTPPETSVPVYQTAHCHSPEERQYLTTHHSDILQYDRILKKLGSHLYKVLSQSSDNLPHLSYRIVYCE